MRKIDDQFHCMGFGKNREMKSDTFLKFMKKTCQNERLQGTNGYWYLLSMLPIAIGNHVALRFDEFFSWILQQK